MRPGVGRAAPRAEFVPWKPEVCQEPGCTARHPAFSRDGMKGPWRCREHDATATRMPDFDPPTAASPAPPRLL